MAELLNVQLKGHLNLIPGRAEVEVRVGDDDPTYVELNVAWQIEGERKPSFVRLQLDDVDEIDRMSEALAEIARGFRMARGVPQAHETGAKTDAEA